MTTPAELQAIRERDAVMDKPGGQEFAAIAFIDRRKLLALYDAQADEVRRLREALIDARIKLVWMLQQKNSAVEFSEHAFPIFERIDAALGSQP